MEAREAKNERRGHAAEAGGGGVEGRRVAQMAARVAVGAGRPSCSFDLAVQLTIHDVIGSRRVRTSLDCAALLLHCAAHGCAGIAVGV